MNTDTQFYIGIMSGTSMDGADAVLIEMDGARWLGARAHAFVPYPDNLRRQLLALQQSGHDELHRSRVLGQELAALYAQAAGAVLKSAGMEAGQMTALGCHGQTVRHAPEHGYSVQLADWALLAELGGIFTVGDFRSRDLAAGGQGAPLVPAFHQALFAAPDETRVLLNIGGIANISILPPGGTPFGFDTGAGNMLMDAWTRQVWNEPYDKGGEKAAQGRVLPDLLAALCEHPYFSRPFPKSTGRELFSLEWLKSYLGGRENPYDVLRTLVQFTADTVADAVFQTVPEVRNLYVCGGGVYNDLLLACLNARFLPNGVRMHSTEELQLHPQWVEAAAFAWLAACWVNRLPGNPYRATGADKFVVLGAGYCA